MMLEKKKYQNSPSVNPNFVQMEEEILKFWKEEKIFEKSLENTRSSEEYIFYDGPPFANGLPHYGHLLTSCAKDVIGRFQTMNGKYVERNFGWDCHGLPAEMAAEKNLGVSGRLAIEEYGIAKFNDHCKHDVMKFSGEWKKYIERIGRWVDMENAYKTMDLSFMESILWAFKNLYDQGLVYRQMRVMPYSWACQTPLSNFETRLDNSYREKESKSLIVKFEINADDFSKSFQNLDSRFCEAELGKIYILVWTTTPWTLPSNLALAVSPEIEYEIAYDPKSKNVYIAHSLEKFASDLKIDLEKCTIFKVQGTALKGLKYKPLFNYFEDSVSKNAFMIYAAEFVTATDGTGIVHIAPGFGEDDFDLCKKNQIGIYDLEEDRVAGDEKKLFPAVPVDDDGKFLGIVKDFAGMHVFDANDEVIKFLKLQNNWVKTSQYLHSYPHCWRTDTPIIYKAMPSYYIEVSKFRERLCALNQEINWIPSGVKDGIFGNWLSEAKDWAISRNRFFGTPIPVWVSTDEDFPCTKVFGSISELEEFFGPYYEQKNGGKKLKITDLHRPFIDELVCPNPNDPSGKSMLKRVADVFDCWFESGAMSFAEVHYPFNASSYNGPQFESKEFNPKIHKPKRLPADFIVEYTAQTRGWFYTLTVLSTLIFDSIPFKNCICHGVILDDKGQKLSKRLGNYIDPIEAMNQYSADALRYVMLSSPVMGGGELLIDKEGRMLTEALKTIQKPIWSALNFFILYAHEDQPDLKLIDLADLAIWSKSLHDQEKEYDFYIVCRAFELCAQIYKFLNEYKIMNAYGAIRDFIDDLNNFYIRANRDRFWGSEMTADKERAFNALYSALYYLSIAVAPLLPFFAEILFQKITDDISHSVHLENYIFNYNEEISLRGFEDLKLKHLEFFESMQILKKIFYHGRGIRDDKLMIRMRQPLKACKIITNMKTVNNNFLFFEKQIKNELNIHEVLLVNEDASKDEASKFFSRKIKLNTRLLGPKFGKEIQGLKSLIDAGNCELVNLSSRKQQLKVADNVFEEGEFFSEIELKKEFIQNASIAHNDRGEYVIIWLDEKIDENLMLEGISRDIIRSIQDARKTTLNIADRIELYIWSESKEISFACEKFSQNIIEQTLAKKFEYKFFDENSEEKDGFEEGLTSNGFCIFGYNVQNSLQRKDIDIKLAFKKI